MSTMSRDSTYTHIHFHASHHADLFEEFCHPPSSTSSSSQPSNSASITNPTTNANGTTTSDPGMIQIPGHFLPFEEILLPPHLMPLNPEDEDDVVPDMHAAFGIQRALGAQGAAGAAAAASAIQGGNSGGERGAQREPVWRDLGLERLLESGGGIGSGKTEAGIVGRREGKKSGILLIR